MAAPFTTRAQAEADQARHAADAALRREQLRSIEFPNPIGLHLWPSAPGLEAVPRHHRCRWRYLWCDPVEALQRVLTRLERGPQLVEIRAHGMETDILGTHDAAWTLGDGEPGAAPVIISEGVLIPLATFWVNVTTAQIEAAHIDLINDGWRPPVKQQSQQERAA